MTVVFLGKYLEGLSDANIWNIDSGKSCVKLSVDLRPPVPAGLNPISLMTYWGDVRGDVLVG